MTDKERTKSIDIPPNTSIEGFMHAVREVIRLPRVQKIVIDKTGRVTFTQKLIEGEENAHNVNVVFDHLQPYHVIRNTTTKELNYPQSMSSVAVVAAMIDFVSSSGLTPIAFVASTSTILWSWIYFSDDLSLANRDNLLGYPLYLDRNIPDTALVLCAGLDGTTALVDTRLSLKIEMQQQQSVMGEEVDVE